MNELYQNEITTPLGLMTALVNDKGLYYLQFSDKTNHRSINRIEKLNNMSIKQESHFYHERIQSQLNEYFFQGRPDFNLPMILSGTNFQKEIWDSLQRIPYGLTSTYQKIANEVAAPKAFRAVGTAVGANPIMIIVPCHRVVRLNGQLGGYAGGLTRKMELLKLEKGTEFTE